MKQFEMENLRKNFKVQRNGNKESFVVVKFDNEHVTLADINTYEEKEITLKTLKRSYHFIGMLSTEDIKNNMELYCIVFDKQFHGISYSIAEIADNKVTLIRLDDMDEMFDVHYSNFVEQYEIYHGKVYDEIINKIKAKMTED